MPKHRPGRTPWGPTGCRDLRCGPCSPVRFFSFHESLFGFRVWVAPRLGAEGQLPAGPGLAATKHKHSRTSDTIPTHAYAHAHAHARQSCGVSERKQGPGRRATEAHGHRPGLQPHAKRSLRGVRPMAFLKGNNLIFQVGLSQPQTAKPWPKP